MEKTKPIAYRKPSKRELNAASSLQITVSGNSKARHTVVLLHGIASNNANWKKIIKNIEKDFKVVNVDLLGFGKSPAPLWSNYSVDTHAKSVMLSLKKAKVIENFILVGHSMGCIISTRIATLNPTRITSLFLVSLPIYKGWELDANALNLKEKILHEGYFKVYDYFCEDALFTTFFGGLITRLVGKPTSFQLKLKNYIAFKRSLKNCIKFQKAENELRSLQIKQVHAYYGTLDMLIIKSYVRKLSSVNPNITVTRVPKSGHVVGGRMSSVVAADIHRTIGESTC